ncbi:MAG: hypothetical protein GYB67_13865 [Chloroflexi bacterium]|nr:hypothetical protein [Chloroflexota bacterium]
MPGAERSALPAKLLTPQRWALLVALVVLLASSYLITYSGRIESGDSRFLFDGVSSLVNHGDLYLDESAWQRPPLPVGADNPYLLQAVNAEPLPMLLAAPLYLLAQALPMLGMVHTVWLFNVIVAALAGGVLFVYILALGYNERTAVLGALAFGLGSIIWVYSKTFFREPLALLLLLLAALWIERLRAGGYRSIPLLIAAVLAVLGLLLTKVSSLLALPALLIIAAPSLRRITRRQLMIGAALLIPVALLFVTLGWFDLVPGISIRYDLLGRLDSLSVQQVPEALHAYLISPGGSVWGTSPVLLLALPGAWLLIRAGRWRYVIAGGALLAAFALGYALLSGPHWFGGLSWPPRFLIPIVPLLLIPALPVLERLTLRPVSRWWFAAGPLLIYSVWVQLSGVTLQWEIYALELPPEAEGLLSWAGGMNQLADLRWVIIPQLWDNHPLDFAWIAVNAGWLIGLFGLVAAASAVRLGRGLRPKARCRPSWTQTALLPVLFAFSALIGLTVLRYDDTRYLSTDETLHAMLPILAAETTPADVILLSSPRYEPFFLNYGKLRGAGRVITLPPSPGEQASPDQPPEVASDNPDVLIAQTTAPLIHHLAAARERLWVLVDGGPSLWWSVRPVERFMAAHYYPTRQITTGPITHLFAYSTVDAPDRYGFRGPQHLTDLVFGPAIRLVGVELPSGLRYAPGSVLPVSLYWTTDAPLDANYTAALFLRHADGAPVTQSDAQPGGGFAPTSGWQVGVPVWDHRGLQLPSDLAPGDYQLWVKLYDFGPDGAIRDLPVTGAATIDGTIGVLPITIQITTQMEDRSP